MAATKLELELKVARLERLVEHKDAILREIKQGVGACVAAAEAYGETDDTHLWREMEELADRALYGVPLPNGTIRWKHGLESRR